jgi:hypothetical protein
MPADSKWRSLLFIAKDKLRPSRMSLPKPTSEQSLEDSSAPNAPQFPGRDSSESAEDLAYDIRGRTSYIQTRPLRDRGHSTDSKCEVRFLSLVPA